MWALILTGAVTTPIGAALLIGLDATVVRVLVGVVGGITAIGMLLGLQRNASRELLVSVPVGAASGVLGGVAGLSGAPVVLFFTNQSVDPREARANIVFYFQVLNSVALPSFAVGGILTSDVFTLAAFLLPATVAGAVAGTWFASRVSVALFRRISLFLVLLAGVGIIVSAIVRSAT